MGYFSGLRYFSLQKKRPEEIESQTHFSKTCTEMSENDKTIYGKVQKYVSSDVREGTHMAQCQVADH